MNKKTYEKSMVLEVKSTFDRKNSRTEKTLKAELSTDNFSFKALADFEKAKQQLDKYIKSLIKQGQHFEMSITIAEYNKDSEYNWKQLSFNYWTFKGVADYTENPEEMGVYLSPDTRYTEASFDVWYNFTLESLPSI